MFHRYSRLLFNVSYKYTLDVKESEDLVQEVFTRVWVHRDNIKDNLPIVPYLIKISKNLIFNQAKKKIYHKAYNAYQRNLASNSSFNHLETEETVLLDELKHMVNEEVDHFPPKRKEIYILSREKGLTTKEIAQKMNIATSTVENHLNKALKILRQRLEYSSYQ